MKKRSSLPDTFDNKRRASEEEYIRRKDQEALDKLRARRAAEAAAKAAEAAAAAAPKCPRCATALTEVEHAGVKIDRCSKCHGVWLDAGELEQLTKRAEGWFKWLAGE
jgi:Zn-finger nucleic acid-binding protein